MIRRKRRPALARAEALGCIPVRNRAVVEERLENGTLRLSVPVGVRPWIARLAAWLGAPPPEPPRRRIELDRLGTAVWERLDGVATLGEIAAAFAREHRLPAREAEAAVGRFVRELGRRGLVGLR